MAMEYGFARLEELGVFDVILPFILVFTIVYAILQKIKLFGEKGKNFNVMIALVMGLGVVFPHVLGYYPPEQDIVLIINHALPNVSVVIVAIVMALIIIGVMGRRWELGDTPLSGWIALGAFGLIVYIFGSAAGWWSLPFFLDMLNTNSDLMALIIVVLVFAIVIYFITKEDKENKKPDENGFAGQFGKMLQKDWK